MNNFNFLDRLIAFISPAAAAKRVQARMLLALHSRRYDAAAKGRRTSGWNAPSTSANAENATGLVALRNRSRDLERNNPHMSKALGVITSETIGDGIVHKYSSPRLDKLFQSWSSTSFCDSAGMNNYFGLQALALRSTARDGEIYVRRIRTPYVDDRTVPLQLQLLEGDFLDVAENRMADNGNRIVQGVEIDQATGKRIAYHIWEQHPGETFMIGGWRTSRRVRVLAEDMAPVFRIDRVGQLRGIPWGAPVMLKMQDYADFEEAQLMRQKIASCFAAIITDANGMAEGETAPPVDRLEPGMMEVLAPGQDVKFGSPPGVDGFKDSATIYGQAIAAGLGISFESMSNDYSNVNFSSARMGKIQMLKNINHWRWNMFIPQFCMIVDRWFLEAAADLGFSSKAISVEHTCPRSEMVDPSVEVPALIKEVRAGLKSLPEALRERGYDYKQVMQEIADSNAELDRLSIVLDTDPRETTQQGMAQMDQNNNSIAP